jgi:hypothetical protein
MLWSLFAKLYPAREAMLTAMLARKSDVKEGVTRICHTQRIDGNRHVCSWHLVTFQFSLTLLTPFSRTIMRTQTGSSLSIPFSVTKGSIYTQNHLLVGFYFSSVELHRFEQRLKNNGHLAQRGLSI